MRHFFKKADAGLRSIVAKIPAGCSQLCDLPPGFSAVDSFKKCRSSAGVAKRSASFHSLSLSLSLSLTGRNKERERGMLRTGGRREEEGGGGAVLMLQPTPGRASLWLRRPGLSLPARLRSLLDPVRSTDEKSSIKSVGFSINSQPKKESGF